MMANLAKLLIDTHRWLSPGSERLLSWGILAACLAMFLLFGTFKVQDAARIVAFDFLILYEAGTMWLAGDNPYLMGAAFNSFAYPPTSAIFFEGLALLPFSLARVIYIVLSYLALILSLDICIKHFQPDFRWRDLSLPHACMIAIILVNPVTLTVFKFGQTSVILLCAALLAWKFHLAQKNLFAAFFLAIATIKPQFSILLIFWLLLQREFKVVTLAGVIGILFVSPLLLSFSPIKIFTDWFSAMSAYRDLEHNQWGFQDIAGLQSLLAALGVHTFSLMPLGGLALGLLYYYRKVVDQRWYFSLFMLIAFTFFFSHDYDYVGLLPFWVGFLLYAISHPRYLFFAMAAIIVFNIPQSLVRQVFSLSVNDISPLLHWRALVLMLVGSCAIFWSIRRSGELVESKA